MPYGPKGEWRPADDRACSVHVAKLATGQIEETYEPPRDPKADHAAASRRASKAGKASAATRTPQQRRALAKAGAAARWGACLLLMFPGVGHGQLSSPVFDTLEVATELRENGFTEEQARVMVDALVLTTQELQTDADADLMHTELQGQDSVIGANMRATYQEVNADIATTPLVVVSYLTSLILGCTGVIVAFLWKRKG